MNEKKRLIPVQWEEGLDEKQYEVNLVVHSDDRNYLLSDIVTTLQQCNVYLKHVDSAVDEGNLEATTKLTVAVKNAAHLQINCELKKYEASMKSFVQFNRKANTFLFSFEFQF